MSSQLRFGLKLILYYLLIIICFYVVDLQLTRKQTALDRTCASALLHKTRTQNPGIFSEFSLRCCFTSLTDFNHTVAASFLQRCMLETRILSAARLPVSLLPK